MLQVSQERKLEVEMEPPSEIIEVMTVFLGGLKFSPPGGRWLFHAGSKNFGGGGFGLELYVDFNRRNIAALKLLRSSCGSKLDGTVEQAITVLQDYFIEEIELLGGGGLMFEALSHPHKTVLDRVTSEMVVRFAAEFANYLDDKFKECFYLIPMTGLTCVEEVNEPEFVWWPWNKDLGEVADKFNFHRTELVAGQFPPLIEGFSLTPLFNNDSWLGCFATHDTYGEAKLRRMAGALFLGLELKNSLMISGAKQPKGLFSVKQGRYGFKTISSPLPHLIAPVTVTNEVAEFVRNVLRAATGDTRLSVALECCGAAWKQSERDRFMQLCVAFDALFGVNGRVTQSIKEGVRKNAENVAEAEDRCRLLLRMRNDLLHGESFALAQCADYLEYNERFGVLPSTDQISLLRACVWNLAIAPT
ncbi:hypothetical protein [Pseudomonas sp. B19125]|uniref:hypothetical protein n=1 Tax=Pseudomonas sp. B19125 TaxID=3235109 RepID=UPI0037851CFD